VLDDAKDLQGKLAPRDKQKLDEYMGSVREIETRIARAEQFAMNAPDPSRETPPGIPAGFEEYIQVMFDMMVLAFQTDSTRVSTFLMANEGSNRAFPEIGIAEGHHFLTHHRNQQDMMDKVAEIDLFYMKQFGRFLDKMAAAKEADGTSLLDHSMIIYGSGNADGNRHTHTNLPVVLAGGGGGTLKTGRFVKNTQMPMSNLYLGILDRLGIDGVEHFGDSTGKYGGI
jgi:hypothetical protein